MRLTPLTACEVMGIGQVVQGVVRVFQFYLYQSCLVSGVLFPYEIPLGGAAGGAGSVVQNVSLVPSTDCSTARG